MTEWLDALANAISTSPWHSALVLIAGTSVGFVRKVSSSEKYGRFNRVFKIVMGALILLLGLYMFYLGF